MRDSNAVLTCYIYLQKYFAFRIILSHFVKIYFYIMHRYYISQRFFLLNFTHLVHLVLLHFVEFFYYVSCRYYISHIFHYIMRRYYISQRFLISFRASTTFCTIFYYVSRKVSNLATFLYYVMRRCYISQRLVHYVF